MICMGGDKIPYPTGPRAETIHQVAQLSFTFSPATCRRLHMIVDGDTTEGASVDVGGASLERGSAEERRSVAAAERCARSKP